MEEEYFPSDRLLELNIGSVVQINREVEEELHFSVSLVGFDANRYVITSLPNKNQLPDGKSYEAFFVDGELLEMKTIHDGRIIAFESSVISMYGERLLISSFPEMIETRRLRSTVRFPCALSCDIRLGEKESFGVIVNISYGGFLLNVPKDIEYEFIEKSIESKISLELEVFFPNSDNSSIISAEVKSATCQIDGACKIGFAFNEDYDCIRKYLESLELDSVAPFFS